MSMQLSSSATFFYKVIFPAVWLAGFGFAAVSTASDTSAPSAMLGDRIDFPVVWLLGAGVFYWLCFPLKYVSLGPTSLRVSGLFTKAEIPLAEIERVSGSVFISPEFITVRLKRPGVFGARIRFMPSVRFASFSAHATVTLLRERLAALPK